MLVVDQSTALSGQGAAAARRPFFERSSELVLLQAGRALPLAPGPSTLSSAVAVVAFLAGCPAAVVHV